MARILVVDDDALARVILRTLLEEEGHTVLEADNGAAALTQYNAHGADAVFMDIFMPEKEGLETIREMKAMHPGVRIIAMTGGSTFSQYETLNWAQSMGARESITKPLDRDTIVASLARAMD